MPAFLSNITPFLGMGTKNEEGKDLNEFLDAYEAGAFECPSVTADILVFQYKKKIEATGKGLKLLMIKRKNHPSIGYWALPGGFVNMREDIKEAAKRELFEETGLLGIDVAQLYCWGGYERDPRTRIVTVSYLAMVEESLEVKAGDDAEDALWFDVELKSIDSDNYAINDEGIIDNDIIDDDIIDDSIIDKKSIINKKNKNIKCQEQVIELTCEERGLRLSASVIKQIDIYNIYSEPEYIVKWSDKIAFDHPCFIIQAIDKIMQMNMNRQIN